MNKYWRGLLGIGLGLAIGVASVRASGQTQAPSETRKTSTPYTGDLTIFRLSRPRKAAAD